MEPLRILNVANVREDPNAGAAGAEFQTIRALRALGHYVDAVWSDQIDRRISHGNLHYLLELPRRYEEVVVAKLRKHPYDVVHVNQPHGFRAAQAVHEHWPAVAFIHRSHGFEPRVEELRRKWERVYGGENRAAWRRGATSVLESLLRRHSSAICRLADGHLLCSSEDAGYMKMRYGVADEKIVVVTHAAPDSYNVAPPLPFTDERRSHVLYVGQFTFIKAPMIVAEAMSRVAAAREDARFTWVAAGADHEAIRALASPGLRLRLNLLDWMPQDALRAVYDSAGIFLFPSFFEGTGKASIEALSRGLCVVATAVGGMRDMIENGVSGVLVEPGSSIAVATSVLSLMNDAAGVRRMSEAAAARAREYTWQRTASRTADFYRARIQAKQVR